MDMRLFIKIFDVSAWNMTFFAEDHREEDPRDATPMRCTSKRTAKLIDYFYIIMQHTYIRMYVLR